MTQEREELLIADVAETKGMLNRFLIEWDSRKASIASCADVDALEERFSEHINDGRHRNNSAGMWVASLAALAALILSAFKK